MTHRKASPYHFLSLTQAGEQVQLFHPRSAQGVDRSGAETVTDDPSSRDGNVHGGGKDDQAAVEDEVDRTDQN